MFGFNTRKYPIVIFLPLQRSMNEQIIVPQIGESINEAQVSRWLVSDGQYVEKDQDVVEIDSDKTTLTVSAKVSGKIMILVHEGTVVSVGQKIAEIIPGDSVPKYKAVEEKDLNVDSQTSENANQRDIAQKNQNEEKVLITPLARSRMQTDGIDTEELLLQVKKKRIGVKDVENFNKVGDKQSESFLSERISERKPMSPLRKKLAQRLVAVKNQTAMLTTFNEIDMGNLIDLRNRYKEDFFNKHGVKLGFMSFFTKACALAIQKFPAVNAMIDGDDIVYFEYADISIAVSTDKGLVVPVVRNTHVLTIPEIEIEIGRIADKARNYKLLPEDLEGGTFTITNGGVFGSLLSTPIINPPQTAILGMHTIQERAVVKDGKIVIRPMMYIALSYDHRIIDGRESVGFVVEVKRLLENPELLHVDCSDKIGKMLDL